MFYRELTLLSKSTKYFPDICANLIYIRRISHNGENIHKLNRLSSIILSEDKKLSSSISLVVTISP